MSLIKKILGKPEHKPLLTRVPIAGLQYYRAAELSELMHQGDELTLAREPDNEHDPNAVMILWNHNKIGYIPSKHTAQISELLDKHQRLCAKIEHIDPNAGESRWAELSVYPA